VPEDERDAPDVERRRAEADQRREDGQRQGSAPTRAARNDASPRSPAGRHRRRRADSHSIAGGVIRAPVPQPPAAVMLTRRARAPCGTGDAEVSRQRRRRAQQVPNHRPGRGNAHLVVVAQPPARAATPSRPQGVRPGSSEATPTACPTADARDAYTAPAGDPSGRGGHGRSDGWRTWASRRLTRRRRGRGGARGMNTSEHRQPQVPPRPAPPVGSLDAGAPSIAPASVHWRPSPSVVARPSPARPPQATDGARHRGGRRTVRGCGLAGRRPGPARHSAGGERAVSHRRHRAYDRLPSVLRRRRQTGIVGVRVAPAPPQPR